MVLLLILLLGGAGGSACQRLTLDECVRRALARSDLAVGESLLAQARAARYRPQVEINALVGPAPSARGSPYDPALRSDYSDLGAFTRAEITGLQPIYTFGKLEGKVDAARHALEVARGAREQVVNEVRRETQKLYYGLLLARELKEVSNQVLGSLGKARARVSESIAGGAGEYTATDQSRLDVFRFEIEARRVAIATSEVSLLEALKAALGFAPSTDFDIADTSLEIPERTNTGLEDALARRPEIRQFEAGEQARAALVRSARADLYPQIFAGGQLRYGVAPNRTDQRNPFIRDDFNFFQGGFAVGFRYSLNFAATRAKVRELAGELERLRAQRRVAETAIRVQASNSARAFEGAELATDVRQKGARAARSWLAAAESGFNLGVGETRDLVDAFQAYLQTRVALLQAIHDENVARTELAYAKGVE